MERCHSDHQGSSMSREHSQPITVFVYKTVCYFDNEENTAITKQETVN